MSFIQHLASFSISVIAFFVIDMLWLGLIAKNLYRKHLGHLMADSVNWPAAFAFYLLFILALQYFAILPALKTGNQTEAWISGAILGFICYATYDLTNLATLKSWPAGLSMLDMVWGTALSSLTAGITTWLMQKFFV